MINSSVRTHAQEREGERERERKKQRSQQGILKRRKKKIFQKKPPRTLLFISLSNDNLFKQIELKSKLFQPADNIIVGRRIFRLMIEFYIFCRRNIRMRKILLT